VEVAITKLCSLVKKLQTKPKCHQARISGQHYYHYVACLTLLSLELAKKAPDTVRGKKEFNSLHCNTGTDPVAGKLFITDDFNVLVWQLTSGIQQLITTELGR